MVHTTFLRIDEKGTEAAAATGVEVELTSATAIEPPTFCADHPFLLLIRDKRTGAIPFLGRIADPTATQRLPSCAVPKSTFDPKRTLAP